jgi:hypothetical protein
MLAGNLANLGEKMADGPRLLPVEAAITENARDVTCPSTLERVPRWVGST